MATATHHKEHKMFTTTRTRDDVELTDEQIEELFDAACGCGIDADDLTYTSSDELAALITGSKDWASKTPRFELTEAADGVVGVVWTEVQPAQGRKRRTVCGIIIGDILAVEGLDN